MNLPDSEKESIARTLQMLIMCDGVLATAALVFFSPVIVLAYAMAGAMPGRQEPGWLFMLILFSFYPMLGAGLHALGQWSPLSSRTKRRFYIFLFLSELFLIGFVYSVGNDLFYELTK